MTDDTEPSVIEMRENGMDWDEIAVTLGTDIAGAMQRYRDEAYDHWDTGWEMDAGEATARFESGVVDVWSDGTASLSIEELRDAIPLYIEVDQPDSRTLAGAELTADQACDLADVLNECADILEGEHE